MGEAKGKKVDPAAVAAQAIEAQPSFGQIKPLRGRVARVRPTASSGEDVAGHRTERARNAGFSGPGKETPAQRSPARPRSERPRIIITAPGSSSVGPKPWRTPR